jgi:hypothetical protein
MRSGVFAAAVLTLSLACAGPARAQEVARKQEPLAEQVKRAISRGVKFLRQTQRADGSWEIDVAVVANRGGETSLALLALLNCGVPPGDRTVARGLDWLQKQHRGGDPRQTYVRALETMVYAEAMNRAEVGRARYKELIKDNVDWLLEARHMNGGDLLGWSYQQRGGRPDNSNTQYALLGLYAGKTADVPIKKADWESIRSFYKRTQQKDGGWPYHSDAGPPTLTMTTAGLCGLLIAGAELNVGREKPRGDGTFKGCGEYDEDEAVARALNWISGPQADRFTLHMPPRTFYNLYGIERAGRLSGQRFFGKHDWYREGCKFLVEGRDASGQDRGEYKQHADGSWSAAGFYDQLPVVSTSFALLFLSKGRTPVLISKLVHGAWPREEGDHDWNNDRNDVRHLTEFASRELFKRLPLAWQNFDAMRAVINRKGDLGEEGLLEVTSELLESPVAYFNGHRSPRDRFRPAEKALLKKYIENGGFLLVEACCGSKEFDAGFRELARELWPDQELTPLLAGHPIWGAHFPVPAGSFHLEGLMFGCKTVLVYSPEDLSCSWESNKLDDGRAQLAFRTGANIIAYATGMEPPQPRLTEVELPSAKEDRRTPPRGYLKAAQLRHGGDWQPAPRAMRNLLGHLHKLADLDVALKTEALPVDSNNLVDFKFLYLHGRGEFEYGDAQLAKLRFNLKTGGLLLSDACCGSAAFDKAFRRLAAQLFPDQKLQPIPADDVLVGKELNGEALTPDNIRCRLERGSAMRRTAPLLEGIKIDGRWVVIYSKYDLGCALERHQSSDCLGYDHQSALRIGSAAVLYLLRP